MRGIWFADANSNPDSNCYSNAHCYTWSNTKAFANTAASTDSETAAYFITTHDKSMQQSSPMTKPLG